MKLLVTGATGFVGRRVAAALARGGREVRGLARDVAGTAIEGVDLVAGDVRDRAAVRAALEGVDGVVHLAARVHVMRETAADPDRAFRRVNVEGTRNVIEEASAAGIGRFVFVSSVKALGETAKTPLPEDATPRPADPYGRSKLAAERVVEEGAEGAGIRAAILRLPLVYGAGMKGNMLTLFRIVDRGVPLPLGSIDNRRSLVHVDNVVAAVGTVLDADVEAGARVYHVADDEDLSTTELVRNVAAALDRSPRLVPVPPAVLQAVGRALGTLASVAPVPDPRPALDRLLGSLRLDTTRIRVELDHASAVSTEAGLRETAAWYRAEEAVR